jgi:hypothetical protein
MNSSVRTMLGALGLALALPLVASADPSTSQGYTAKDQTQFAKLAALNGTWTCKDTPASKKPDVVTGKQVGNWYVWSETGDMPNTVWARWNHTMQAYTQDEIDASGSAEIATTKSLDPFNATWTWAYPTNFGFLPFKGLLVGKVITWSGSYVDRKTKKLSHYKSVCTKG